MKKILTTFIFLSVIFYFGFFISTATAQNTGSVGADISVELNPSIPGPNQTVTATASSYSVELNSASISWTINGKVKQKGTGNTTFTFTTGASNQTTTLGVTVLTTLGQFIQKSFPIKPASVDIVWQTDGYVPPFYKGKALFSHENKIEFIAIPHIIQNGAEVPASNLIYKWTRNGDVLGDFSGYGKSTYTMISGVISRPLEIAVEVTSPTSDDVAQNIIVASPDVPSIMFYKKDPLYGIQFQKALTGTVDMGNKQEIEVVSAPFYFNQSGLTYNWTVNGTDIGDSNGNSSQIFRQKPDVYGQSLISLSVENVYRLLQFADSSFTISFTKPPTQ